MVHSQYGKIWFWFFHPVVFGRKWIGIFLKREKLYPAKIHLKFHLKRVYVFSLD